MNFDGRINEFPNLFIDNFSLHFIDFKSAQAFILSHAHSDHMNGLDGRRFQESVSTHPRLRFYCSNETKEILKCDKRFSRIIAKILTKKVNQPFEVTLSSPEGESVIAQVTFLPAQHCPGSISIYLKAKSVCVLYTGDYRWEEPSYRSLSFLRAFHPQDSVLDHLYLDTTFCDEDFPELPTRHASAERVAEVIEDWLSRDPRHVVNFDGKSHCGHEKLYAYLNDRFSTKTHVSDRRLRQYGDLSEVTALFTRDAASTRMHACSTGDDESCFKIISVEMNNVLHITASTQWWTRKNVRSRDILERVSPQRARLMYSFHPSLIEQRELVNFIKPRFVTPIVTSDRVDVKTVAKLLNFISENHVSLSSSSSSGPSTPASLQLSRLPLHSSDDSWNDLFKSEGQSQEILPVKKRAKLLFESGSSTEVKMRGKVEKLASSSSSSNISKRSSGRTFEIVDDTPASETRSQLLGEKKELKALVEENRPRNSPEDIASCNTQFQFEDHDEILYEVPATASQESEGEVVVCDFVKGKKNVNDEYDDEERILKSFQM